jgi:hydroxymethylpyrimidine pyrophosphatase-like HAD family hydrolase
VQPVGLVALDLDGTLLGLDGSLSEAVREAVHAAAGRSELVVATGRSLHTTLPALAALGLDSGFVVASNGSVLARVDAGRARVEWTVTFDARPAVELVRAALPDALFGVEELGRGYRVTEAFPDGELTGETEVVGLERLLADPVNRVVVRTPDRAPSDFLTAVAAAGLQGLNYVVGYTSWLDLMPPGVSKATALEDVRERLGVAPEATLAVGDGPNDLTMLSWAGWGVAMGHAPPDVMAAADEVTATVDDDGAAAVLHRYLLDGQA